MWFFHLWPIFAKNRKKKLTKYDFLWSKLILSGIIYIKNSPKKSGEVQTWTGFWRTPVIIVLLILIFIQFLHHHEYFYISFTKIRKTIEKNENCLPFIENRPYLVYSEWQSTKWQQKTIISIFKLFNFFDRGILFQAKTIIRVH